MRTTHTTPDDLEALAFTTGATVERDPRTNVLHMSLGGADFVGDLPDPADAFVFPAATLAEALGVTA